MKNKIISELKNNFWFRIMVILYIVIIVALMWDVGEKTESFIWTTGDVIKGIFLFAVMFFIGFKAGEKSNFNKYR
jgi:formate hydrogenlyase subunit 4